MTDIKELDEKIETALLDISALFIEYAALHEDMAVKDTLLIFGGALMERLDAVGRDVMLGRYREEREQISQGGGTDPDIVQSHVS